MSNKDVQIWIALLPLADRRGCEVAFAKLNNALKGRVVVGFRGDFWTDFDSDKDYLKLVFRCCDV